MKENGSSAEGLCQHTGKRERWRCVRGCNCSSREMVYYSVHLAVHLNYYAHCSEPPSPATWLLPSPPSTPLSWQRKILQHGYEGPSRVCCLSVVKTYYVCLLCSKHCPENNLFLVRRLIKKTDMRNPDPTHKRYTSLAWAAVLGHEETFEFLLSSGHDERERSKVCTLCI